MQETRLWRGKGPCRHLGLAPETFIPNDHELDESQLTTLRPPLYPKSRIILLVNL